MSQDDLDSTQDILLKYPSSYLQDSSEDEVFFGKVSCSEKAQKNNVISKCDTMDNEEFEALVNQFKDHLSLIHLRPEEIEDKQIVQDTEVWINQRGEKSRQQGDFLNQYDDVSNQHVYVSSKHYDVKLIVDENSLPCNL